MRIPWLSISSCLMALTAHAAPPATTPATTRAVASLTAELPNLTAIEIVRITSNDRPDAGWWAPDGTPLDDPPASRLSKNLKSDPRWPLWTVEVRVRGVPAKQSPGWAGLSVVK